MYEEEKSRTTQTLAWVIGRMHSLYTTMGKISGKTNRFGKGDQELNLVDVMFEITLYIQELTLNI